MNSSHRAVALGAFSAAIGVAAGAFGAHGLKSILSPEMLSVYETAVRYQMYHALGLIVTGSLVPGSAWSARAATAFVAGTVLFSGSLFALTLTDMRWLGAVTPVGGVCFVAGWILLGVAAWKR